MKKRIVVIGAGPAGLTCAVKLLEAGHEVDLIEAGPHVGGLCRSFKLWDQIVDFGPHRFFSTDPEVVGFWKEVVGKEFALVERLTRIHYRGKYFRYPLQGVDLLKNLRIHEIALCGLSFFAQKLKHQRVSRSFEDWVVRRFGRRLYDMFFKTYTEKLWGLDGSEIDADWASQRIKSLSVLEVLGSILGRKKQHSSRTLLEQFAYPAKGTGMVYERLAERVRAQGGRIHLSSPVEEVTLDQARAVSGVRLKDGRVLQASQVVSTMPLTLMVRGLREVPAEVTAACDKLRYRNTTLVYLEVDQENLFPDNWIYVHSPEVRHGRITNFRNRSPGMHGDKKTTILCLEYWSFNGEPMWEMTDLELGRLAKEETERLGLLPSGARVLGSHVVRLSRSYPVYERGYGATLQVIQNHVDSIQGLYAIGRYGAFKYNNQDHSIKMGLLAARQIDTGVDQGLWRVNCDQDYQEAGTTSRKLEA